MSGILFFFFSSRSRHTRFDCDWSSDVCSSDLPPPGAYLSREREVAMDGRAYEPLAEIEVDQVKPERQGFMLTGQGPDNAEYQLDLRFGMPLDPRTRTVLGELLSHSDLIISRRAPGGLAQALHHRRNRVPQR